ncbi:unnamed protein product [Trichogramma brassicae]|uniref:CCHC-type domain-containing protein n=1 Tax=Trichogramma brassicae TaxID=86971 RepID=A0A6H5J4I1_9HYME|nr:unnamed protein product [Trichogramma brassicae]
MKDDELLDEVYVRNLKEEVDAEERWERTMRVKFRIGARSREKEGVVLLEVSPRIRQALLGTGSEARLYIGMRAYFVEAFERVSRCFGCYGFNHRAIECKRGKLCSRCCKEGHLAADCREPEECGNCRILGNAAAALTEYGRTECYDCDDERASQRVCRTDSDHGVQQPDRGVRLIRHDVALRIESHIFYALIIYLHPIPIRFHHALSQMLAPPRMLKPTCRPDRVLPNKASKNAKEPTNLCWKLKFCQTLKKATPAPSFLIINSDHVSINFSRAGYSRSTTRRIYTGISHICITLWMRCFTITKPKKKNAITVTVTVTPKFVKKKTHFMHARPLCLKHTISQLMTILPLPPSGKICEMSGIYQPGDVIKRGEPWPYTKMLDLASEGERSTSSGQFDPLPENESQDQEAMMRPTLKVMILARMIKRI